MESNTAMAFVNGLINHFIKENGRIISTMAEVNTIGKMAVDTLANGRKV